MSGSWDKIEGKIKEEWGDLTNDQVLEVKGKYQKNLVEGKAIQVHPLVCKAYNADFDGDQMAVHLPLSAEAQAEARLLMLSTHNILSPASGEPLATPSQDMVLGLYYLTWHADDLNDMKLADFKDKDKPQRFGSAHEIIYAFENNQLEVHDLVWLRLDQYRDDKLERRELITTVGRAIFHDNMVRAMEEAREVFDSAALEFVNDTLTTKRVSKYIVDLIDQWGTGTVAQVLDTIKETGFTFATKSGTTISKDDIIIPDEKETLLAEYEERVKLIVSQWEMGLITDEERKEAIIDLWTAATEDVATVMVDYIHPGNPIYMMVDSGARGSFKNISQLAGMRGLMSNPKGEIIDQPIRSNFMEGLSVLEFFISTHGARKGLADTALRTADSGYLTRRLVDVSQDVIIRIEDCKTKTSVELEAISDEGEINVHVLGLSLTEAFDSGTNKYPVGTQVSENMLHEYGLDKPLKLNVRSVLYCEAERGICQTCYGRSLATGHSAQIGDVVGIIAAQSIGEPGTQLTMRTFHTGGVAGADITHGLPRVVEIFEARNPKGQAEMFAPADEEIEHYEGGGVVSLEELEHNIRVTVVPKKKVKDLEPWSVLVPRGRRIYVEEGTIVEPGDALTEGSLNPAELLRLRGTYRTARYLVGEVQKVYQSQGVEIHDKHIEIITRQMLRKIRVLKGGESDWLPGELVDRNKVDAYNKSMGRKTSAHVQYEQIILGITKASLATDSFFSAASFQETTKVLTDAALEGKTDILEGLKENVIIGKLIPAATGLAEYTDIQISPAERPKSFYAAEEFLSGLDLGDDFDFALDAEDKA